MEAVGRCCRNIYTQPFDRQKVIYVCGAIGGVVLVVIVVCTVLYMTPSTSAPVVPPKGSDVLNKVPLIIGFNNLPENIKKYIQNKVSKFNFTEAWKSNPLFVNCTTCQTDYPSLKAGRVAAQIWSANVGCTSEYKDAVSQTMEQIDAIQRLISFNPTALNLVTTSLGIQTNFAKNSAFISSIISVNGGHSIDNRLSVLRLYYQLGVRVMAIASSCNTPWAMSYIQSSQIDANKSSLDTGLSSFGKNVVKEMNRLGIVIDLSGTSYKTQLDVLEVSTAPVIFSHSGVYETHPDDINVKDEVLVKLKENKGLFMVTFSPAAYSANLTTANISDLISPIDHLKNKLGPEFMGIGGGYDVDTKYPSGLENITTIVNFFDVLNTTSRWTLPELEGLAGNNFLRVLQRVEEVRDNATATADETWETKADIIAANSTGDSKSAPPCYTDFDSSYA